MLRSTTRRQRKPDTDLRLRFDNDELNARLSARGPVDHKGTDTQVICKHCHWISAPFPYDAWVVRGHAEQHFIYRPDPPSYVCKKRLD